MMIGIVMGFKLQCTHIKFLILKEKKKIKIKVISCNNNFTEDLFEGRQRKTK